MDNREIKNFHNILFQVLVPKISLYTEDEIRYYGFNYDVVDGVPKRGTQMELCNCMISAAKMLEIYSNGYSIRLVDKNDLNLLYKVLEEYLQFKYNSNNMSINRRKYDETELRQLDEFVNEMFGYNKVAIVKNIMDIKNGFSLGLGFMPDKELKKSHHIPNEPISDVTEGRYGKISQRLAERQNSNISNSPVIDFDSIERNRVLN